MHESVGRGGRKSLLAGRRKLAVLSLGGVGLAAALTVAAFAAPDRAARAAARYTPDDPAQVIARVPTRDADELAARRALAASPDSPDTAVQLARLEIQRYHRFSDPRYLGRAEAILGRWWKLPSPPPDILLLRATIRQAVHEFPAARADLDQLIALRPTDMQAQLTRAVVSTITADYAAARESCATVAKMPRVGALVAATCEAPLDGLAGHADAAYTRLSTELARSRAASNGIKGWALTALAELAVQRGDTTAAAGHLHDALALDDDDVYARNLLFDILLETHRAGEASELLANRESVDSHLVRLAISEHQLRSTDAARLAGLMRERIEAAAKRGERIHLREEARFTLAVEGDAAHALELARDNWAVQKELADARLLAECALSARDRSAALPVITWARRTGVRDAWLDRSLTALEGL